MAINSWSAATMTRVPGYFVPVTVLDNPPEDARIVAEEQFGPVMPLMKFSTVDEASAAPMRRIMAWQVQSGPAIPRLRLRCRAARNRHSMDQ